MQILETSITSPGLIELWLNSQVPRLVLPVESNDTEAMRFGCTGKIQFAQTAGNIATRYGAGIPNDSPIGIRAAVVAPGLIMTAATKARTTANIQG